MSLRLLVDPDAFFRAESNGPRLTYSAVVVVLAGVATSMSSALITFKLASAFPSEIRQIAAVGGVLGIAMGFAGVFFLWLVYAAVFQVLSRLFDGEGEFRRTFVLVGWGFVPAIFSGLVSAAAAYYATTGIAVPESAEAMQSFSRQMTTRPTLKLANAVGMVFTLWSGFLWTFALKHARNLDLRESALTVGGPVVVTVLWTAYKLL